MNRHVGGKEYTNKLLSMASAVPPMKILDMGSGDGETVEYLKSLGFDAAGVDKRFGDDFLHLQFEDESFDAVISECAFFISGSQKDAVNEAFRILKRGGTLMLADVFFDDIPFEYESIEDVTEEWKQYYFEKLWSGDIECEVPPHKGKVHYYLLTGRKK